MPAVHNGQPAVFLFPRREKTPSLTRLRRERTRKGSTVGRGFNPAAFEVVAPERRSRKAPSPTAQPRGGGPNSPRSSAGSLRRGPLSGPLSPQATVGRGPLAAKPRISLAPQGANLAFAKAKISFRRRRNLVKIVGGADTSFSHPNAVIAKLRRGCGNPCP